MNTNTMNTLEQLEYLKKVWATVLPSVPLPPDDSFTRWAASFGVVNVEAVINEIPYRLQRTTRPPVDAIYRIVSSQLKSRKARVAAVAVKDTGFEALLKAVHATEMTDQNIARCYSMFILQEMVNCPRPELSMFSSEMLAMTVYVNAQTLVEKPCLKLVASKVLRIVDSIEARTGSGEGQALARLRRFEEALREELNRQSEGAE
jgi:hypothetical protein